MKSFWRWWSEWPIDVLRASRSYALVAADTGESSVFVTLPPPLALAKAFSPSGSGRIFPLFSRVMREGLSTGPRARRPGSGLSGPIFSGPDDCVDLVNFLQSTGKTTTIKRHRYALRCQGRSPKAPEIQRPFTTTWRINISFVRRSNGRRSERLPDCDIGLFCPL
jgi:hypothetical protein